MTDGAWQVSAQLYLESLLGEREKQVAAHFAAIDKEMVLYREEVRQRLHVLNDHAEHMQELRSSMLPRETYESEMRWLRLMTVLSLLTTLCTLILHFWPRTP